MQPGNTLRLTYGTAWALKLLMTSTFEALYSLYSCCGWWLRISKKILRFHMISRWEWQKPMEQVEIDLSQVDAHACRLHLSTALQPLGVDWMMFHWFETAFHCHSIAMHRPRSSMVNTRCLHTVWSWLLFSGGSGSWLIQTLSSHHQARPSGVEVCFKPSSLLCQLFTCTGSGTSGFLISCKLLVKPNQTLCFVHSGKWLFRHRTICLLNRCCKCCRSWFASHVSDQILIRLNPEAIGLI